jgi:cbb3-type cytochrome oxidase subunit 1
MSTVEHFKYDNAIVRNFAIATITFGIIGMLVGLWIALELVFPAMNLDLPWQY